MRTAASVLLFAWAGFAAAQTPATPQADPKITAPMVTQQGTAGAQRQPAPSRNQFFSPVMGIQIEGPGVAVPKGVAEEEPIKPPATEPQSPTPTPAASPK
jgi:hypothetical protein